MKEKDIQAEIKSLKEVLKDAAEVIGKIKRGEKVKPKKGLSFGPIT